MKPNHLFTLILINLLAFQTIHAQFTSKKVRYKKKDFWEIQAGIGLTPTFLQGHIRTIIPPTIIGTNYRITPHIGAGFHAGFSISEGVKSTQAANDQSVYRNAHLSLSFRASAHLPYRRRWEFYGGALIAYNPSWIEIRIEDPAMLSQVVQKSYQTNNLYYTGFVGGRYAINPKTGIYSELGLGVSLFCVGVSRQFR